jgi:hypothetical protein
MSSQALLAKKCNAKTSMAASLSVAGMLVLLLSSFPGRRAPKGAANLSSCFLPMGWEDGTEL